MPGLIVAIIAMMFMVLPPSASAESGQKWVAAWAGSAQGPYPVGNPSAQPDQRFAFPSATTGAKDQTFRLVLRPSIWGRQARIRLTNAFGTQPLSIDGAFVALQQGGAALTKGTSRPVTFAGKTSVNVRAGDPAWRDAVAFRFV